MTLKAILLVFVAMVLLLVVLMAVRSAASRRPARLATVPDALPPCPATPNCVTSGAPRRSQRVDPLPLPAPPAVAVERARELISTLPRARVVTTTDRYLHAEFRSRLFRFVDDVELLLETDPPAFQVRSASRIGRSDLGANRRRVETLRGLFAP